VQLARPFARRAIRWLAALPGPTIKAALFLGCALICATWLFTGYFFANRMTDLKVRATSISERYMRGQELLTTVRSQVLVGSVYVRDALLDADHGRADEYRGKLEEACRAADRALRQYVPVADGREERRRMVQLRDGIEDFRTTVLNVLATDSTRWPVEARTLLRTDIMPKRESVIRATDEVQTLNRSAFVQQQNDVAGVYRATQRGLWDSLGVAVVVSFAIAVLAATYVGRLEERVQRQRLTEADNARNLQRLSMKLITAQEEERRLIARELHDEVGQALTAIKVELAVAQRTIAATGAPTDALDDARSIAEGVLHTVRDLSHLLHPAVLDDLGLSAAVDSYLKGFGKRHAIRVDLVSDIDQRLQPEMEAAAFRIIQEALTNVAKHARAPSCRVYLQRLTNTLLVTIEDDGIGFDPARSSCDAHGLGLIGIRERVARLGGLLRLESALGKGTRVTVELPGSNAQTAEITADDHAAAPVTPTTIHEVLGG
jgi:signal transduction histidine kinase